MRDYYDNHLPNQIVHTAIVENGTVVSAFRWIRGGQFTKDSNTDLPNLIGQTVDNLHALGFRKRASDYFAE
jgi:hypothetical protein